MIAPTLWATTEVLEYELVNSIQRYKKVVKKITKGKSNMEKKCITVRNKLVQQIVFTRHIQNFLCWSHKWQNLKIKVSVELRSNLHLILTCSKRKWFTQIDTNVERSIARINKNQETCLHISITIHKLAT